MKGFKIKLEIMWLRFRRNCYKGSINYADRKINKKFDRILYDQRKIYRQKLQVINMRLFNMRRV